jgi:hypothetical protein
MKMAVFWVVVPCSLVEVYRGFTEAARTSETSINFYQTVQHNHPEDSHLYLAVSDNYQCETDNIKI